MRIFLVSFFSFFAIGLGKVIRAGISLRLFFLEPYSLESAFHLLPLSVRKPKLPLTSRERNRKEKKRKVEKVKKVGGLGKR
ncbi:hypothetical protein B9Z19DRAFT_791178 [Tuber borchii]|uniref:Uncharacterized protein n=1 Tax=Tuber borchii TaxID=42251 RepID=A0A2T6ZWD1_TUBBO|nr:hypothetical protein B9Z19DRAFT_791178 [Tuber borchii]